MRLFVEKISPYLLGFLVGLAAYLMEVQFPKSDAILSSTLTVSGIFVGFMATSKAILISMSSPVITELRSSGYMVDLISYIGSAIWINLVFCGISVLGFFLVEQPHTWYPVLWLAASTCALTAFIRVTHIMLKIFNYS